MEIEINGRLFVNEEMSHQEFIYKLMRALDSENLFFVGEMKTVSDKERSYT